MQEALTRMVAELTHAVQVTITLLLAQLHLASDVVMHTRLW